ncbi:Interleukin-1 receptor-associated kinase 4 [Branchiostoma belcheri]|nr:Interleukin-1 receptor-associated kinase 4 [Branchiostoma belcheri]
MAGKSRGLSVAMATGVGLSVTFSGSTSLRSPGRWEVKKTRSRLGNSDVDMLGRGSNPNKMGSLQAELANKENNNHENTVKESTVCKDAKTSGNGSTAVRSQTGPVTKGAAGNDQRRHAPVNIYANRSHANEGKGELKATGKNNGEEPGETYPEQRMNGNGVRSAEDLGRTDSASPEGEESLEAQEDLEEDTGATSSSSTTSTAETNMSPLEPPISNTRVTSDTEATDIPAEGMSVEAPGVTSKSLPPESCPGNGPAPSTVHVENAFAVQVGIGNVLSLAQTDESENAASASCGEACRPHIATVAVYINNCGAVQVGNHNWMVVEQVAPKVTPQENAFVKACCELDIDPKTADDIREKLSRADVLQQFAKKMETYQVTCRMRSATKGASCWSWRFLLKQTGSSWCAWPETGPSSRVLDSEVPSSSPATDHGYATDHATDLVPFGKALLHDCSHFVQVLLETFLPELAAEGRAVNMNLAIGVRNPSQDMLDELQGAVALNSHENIKLIEIPNGVSPDTAAAALPEQQRRDSPGSDSPGTNYCPSPPDCPPPDFPMPDCPIPDFPMPDCPMPDCPSSPDCPSPPDCPMPDCPMPDCPSPVCPPQRNSPGMNSPGFSTNTPASNTDDIYKLTSLLRLLSEPGDAEDETRQEETTVSAEGLVADMPIEESNANIQASEDNNDQRLEISVQRFETDDQSLEINDQRLEINDQSLETNDQSLETCDQSLETCDQRTQTNDQRLDTDLQRQQPEEQSYDRISGYVSVTLTSDEAACPGLSAHPEVPPDVTTSQVFERSRSQETGDEETTKLLRHLALSLDIREWKQVAQALRVPQPEKDLSAADTSLRMRILRDWQAGPSYGEQFDRLLLALQECGRDDFAVELLQSAPQTIYTTSSGPPTRGVAETPSVVPTQVKETSRQPKKPRKPPVDPRTPLRRLPYQLMKKIAMELDPPGPLANWKDLADCAGYSMQEIGVFDMEYQRKDGSPTLAHGLSRTVLDPGCCSMVFGMEYLKPDGSPTRALLQAWGTRNATVQDLLNALRQTELLNVAEMLAPDDSDDEDV